MRITRSPARPPSRAAAVLAVAALLASAAVSAPASAQSRGDWTAGIGVHQVNPTSDNGKLAGGTLPLRVGSDVKPTVTAEYFVANQWGIELLASWAFEHELSIQGLGRVGTAKQLPPTLSLQYHFNGGGKVSPFVGAGLNYTTFFSEKATGALAGGRLHLDDAWGLAAHVGVDFNLSTHGALRVDAR
ncbi:MAG TPA: OmpW family outer membrane protein, partial [Stenotrophomonas sp.]